jgi:hypothetical protein
VELAGRKRNFDLDAPDEADSQLLRRKLRLGKAGKGIMIGEGEDRNADLGGTGQEFGGRITPVAGRGMTV